MTAPFFRIVRLWVGRGIYAAGVLLVIEGGALAQTTWTGGTGDWFNAPDWDNGVPVSNQANINNNGVAQVTAGGATAGSLVLGFGSGEEGKVEVDGAAATLAVTGQVSLGADGTGVLDVKNGGVLTAGSVILGQTSGNGFLDITNGTLITGGISKGTGSTGIFDMNNAVLRASGSSASFLSGFAAGDVTLFGTGTTIDTNGFNITVSAPIDGDGSLTKTGSGILTLTGANTYTGANSAFNGTVVEEGTLRVSGSGASISHGGRDFIVGNSAVEILNGGRITSAAAAINGTAGTPGTALIQDESRWDFNGPVFVGTSGTGTLTVLNGSHAEINSNLFIGDQAGSEGTVTVDGGPFNSSLATTGSVFVGNFGVGEFNVLGGSIILTSGGGFIGAQAGSTGTVNISGAQSVWNTGLLAVGSLGNGTLNITDGGTMANSGNGQVGISGNSSGSVTVSGTNSTWTSLGLLSLGDGSVLATGGGAIRATSGFIGTRGGFTGTLTVTGANSTADFSSLLAVGNGGTGLLEALAGGKVTSVGNSSVNNGSAVLVSGAGSSWVNTGDLSVQNGSTVTVSGGGLLQNTRSFVVNGNVTVTGNGSTWLNTSEAAFGGQGDDSVLTVANGGIVRVDNGPAVGGGTIYMGYGSEGIATLNIGAAVGDAAVGAGTIQAAVVSSGFNADNAVLINFNHTDSNYVFAPQITRNAAVAHYAGVTSLTATNDYAGPTFVYGGTLVAGGTDSLGTFFVAVDDSLGQNSTLRVAAGASLNLPVNLISGTIVNDGTMTSGGTGALILGETGTVINNGTMTSDGALVSTTSPFTAINVTNNGIMQLAGAIPGDAVIGVGEGSVITNTGTGQILSDAIGVVLSAGMLNNAGSIVATGADFSDGFDGTGVYMQGGVLNNSGNITANNAGVLSLGAVQVNNSGLIFGQNRPSILALGGAVITNQAGGEIRGGSGLAAIFSVVGPTNLSNAGLISGNVVLGPAQANTVTLFTGSNITGSLIVGPNPGSQLILDGTGTSNFSGSVGSLFFAGGTLTKQGTGTWVLDQAMPYAGDTIVNNGRLVIDGSVLGNVQVNAGILGGNGTIGGNLANNGGTVNVGNSPGILNVGGNFVQGPNGTFIVEVAGNVPGLYDQLNAGGTVTMNGALVLQILPGYVPQIGDTYNFLTAGLGGIGQFSSFTTSLNGSLQANLTYGADGLPQIVIIQGLFNTPGFARTPNQRSVAANLDTFSTSGQSAPLFNYLNSLPGTSLADAYDQISPDEYGSMSRPILSYNATQQSNLQRRFADLRAGSTGFSANGFTLLGFDRSLLLAGGGDAMARQILGDPNKSPMRVAKDNKWGFFVNGAGQFGDMKTDGNGTGYEFTTGGINLGMDYRLSESVVVGGSLGYANSSTDTGGSGGSIQANNAKALLYASWFNKGFYANGAVGGGGTSYDTKRNVLGSQVSGDTSGGDFTTFLGTGYDFKAGALTIGPAVSLEYSYVNVSGFTERGGLAPLQIQDQNLDSLRSRMGMLASYLFEAGDVRIIPTLNAAWQHEFLDSAGNVAARFANGAGGVFGVQSAEAERDSAILGLGVNVEWSPTLSTYLAYDAEAAERFLAQSISGGVRVKF